MKEPKTILLLGGFGFIGANILKFIDAMPDKPYRVIVFDKFKFHPYNLRFSCVKKVYDGDFSNVADIEIIFKENRIDSVIHTLSTTVPINSDNRYFDIESNLIPTISLLDLMVKYNVQKIIYLSSGGAIYGSHHAIEKYDENSMTYPISSHGIVKLTVEKYLYQYSYLHDIQSTMFRLSNSYGKYHYNDKQGVVNVATRAALLNKPFTVWGDGSAEKDYIYVEDFCDILFRLIEDTSKFLLLNIGSGEVLSTNKILKIINEHIPSFTWEYTNKIVETDVQKIGLNTKNLMSLLDGYEFTPFSVGVEKTISWLKDNFK
jgi:UDP-glucose 4-epimerase